MSFTLIEFISHSLTLQFDIDQYIPFKVKLCNDNSPYRYVTLRTHAHSLCELKLHESGIISELIIVNLWSIDVVKKTIKTINNYNEVLNKYPILSFNPNNGTLDNYFKDSLLRISIEDNNSLECHFENIDVSEISYYKLSKSMFFLFLDTKLMGMRFENLNDDVWKNLLENINYNRSESTKL